MKLKTKNYTTFHRNSTWSISFFKNCFYEPICLFSVCLLSFGCDVCACLAINTLEAVPQPEMGVEVGGYHQHADHVPCTVLRVEHQLTSRLQYTYTYILPESSFRM